MSSTHLWKKDMTAKNERLNRRILRHCLISIALVFILFSSTPEIQVFGFNINVDTGFANATEVEVWDTPQCSVTAAAWAVIFAAIGTLALFAFGLGLPWVNRAKTAAPLEFAVIALLVFVILLAITFWGVSIYIFGSCAYLYVSSTLF